MKNCLCCVERLDALEANNWTNINIQRNYQWLQHQVLTPGTALAMSVYAKMPCSNLQKYYIKFFLPQICIALEVVLLRLA